MEKQKEPSYITEQKKFAKNLSGLMKEKGSSQTELAAYVKCTRQAISKYTTGQSTPDIDILLKIAEFFKVSTDYLLGLTDVKTVDLNIRDISEMLGLSEDAVNNLIGMSVRGTEGWGNGVINKEHLDAFFSYRDLVGWFLQISRYLDNVTSLKLIEEEMENLKQSGNADINKDHEINARFNDKTEACEFSAYKVSKLLNGILESLKEGESHGTDN